MALLDVSAGWLYSLRGVEEWLRQFPVAAVIVGCTVLLLAAWVVWFVIRRIILTALRRMADRTATFWDEVIMDQKVFEYLAWAPPLLMIHQGLPAIPHLPAALFHFLQRLALATVILVIIRALSALLTGINVIYNRYPIARNRPIKGYVQVGQILLYLIGGIFIIATLINQSPWYFVSGIGAMMAIILLVFRDTLLSLVAGIQLVSNDLIRVGDWVEMPEFSADGDVVDIALHTVRIQNWDRTITVIPTHKFLEHSFKNWRGMTESGGRRIKRAIHIDVATIRFLTDDEIEHFSRFALLKAYMTEKQREIETHNQQHIDPDVIGVGAMRRLTNIGTFRAYIVNYLRRHPRVHQEMTFLIRHLEPGAEGLPIEVYVFVNDTNWVNYEAVQSDIFDHLLAVVPEFGLRVYQRPSGYDLTQALSSGSHNRTLYSHQQQMR
jgi:miniconductance mechanosensitive channel